MADDEKPDQNKELKKLQQEKADKRRLSFIREFTDAAVNFSKTLTGKKPSIEFEDMSAGDAMRASKPGDDKLILPKSADIGTKTGRAAARAHIDMNAASQMFHKKEIHNRHRPRTKKARAIYDLLEKARCDGLMSEKYLGSKANIDANTKSYLEHEADKDNQQNQALNAIYLQLKNAVQSDNPDALEQEFVDQRHKIMNKHGLTNTQKLSNLFKDMMGKEDEKIQVSDILNELSEHAEDQHEYAKRAKKVAGQLASFLKIPKDGAAEEEGGDEQSDEAGEDEEFDIESDGESGGPMRSEIVDLEKAFKDAQNSDPNAGVSKQQQKEKEIKQNLPPQVIEYGDVETPYKVYTTEFDEVVNAKDLANEKTRRALRDNMDRSFQSYKTLVSKLAARLQRRLMAMQMRSWDTDLEEGKINPARLARVVTSKENPRAFREEKKAPFKDTALTILVDNSGSMKANQKALYAAITAEILAQSLERAGIKVEVLGFTTVSGVRSHTKWVQDNRKKLRKERNPGRVDDVRHIIYKEFNEPYRRIKDNIPVMTYHAVQQQNHDGEALIWAHNRLIKRPEERKILIVISDGQPAGWYQTAEARSIHNLDILARFLKDVATHIEENSPVELNAIGIFSPVERFYKNWIKINNAQELGEALIDKLDELFEDPNAPKRKKKQDKKESPPPRFFDYDDLDYY